MKKPYNERKLQSPDANGTTYAFEQLGYKRKGVTVKRTGLRPVDLKRAERKAAQAK